MYRVKKFVALYHCALQFNIDYTSKESHVLAGLSREIP